MTEENIQAIDEAPAMEANNEALEATEAPEVEELDAQSSDHQDGDEGGEGDVEFPKKAVNALNRKDKKINKLRAERRELQAQMRELEAKLKDAPQSKGHSEINPDDFDNYGDYINAQVEALVEQRMTQSQYDMQKQQLTKQQEQELQKRNEIVLEQAREAAQTLTDLPQLWEQNAAILDALPDQITDMFYELDNAAAAVYVLAKEGKLQGLMHKNPYLAANEIINAQSRGIELLSKPQTRISQAPQPIKPAGGNVKTSKTINQMSGKELLDRFAK